MNGFHQQRRGIGESGTGRERSVEASNGEQDEKTLDANEGIEGREDHPQFGNEGRVPAKSHRVKTIAERSKSNRAYAT